MPLVSVVIPIDDLSRKAVRTVGNVLAQPFNDTEVTVVDDGSTDNLVETIRECF
jgi:glycosyltransferase involved in cell wall biosynthesis